MSPLQKMMLKMGFLPLPTTPDVLKKKTWQWRNLNQIRGLQSMTRVDKSRLPNLLEPRRGSLDL
uniref:Uncharacterized protein n=1 Tax=Picea sitchensis TaxID=3332 RepID=A9NWF7_PICSI|nr:unknown [Picea sitchensis]